MILEITIVVYLAIVLALMSLLFWRQLLRILLLLLAAAVAISPFVAFAIFGLKHVSTAVALGVAGGLLFSLFMIAVPSVVVDKLPIYPGFKRLMDGEEPWNTRKRLPLRLSVMAVVGGAVAGLFIGSVAGGISFGEYIVAILGAH